MIFFKQTSKSPECIIIRGFAYTAVFFHPDSTVGFGIKPNLLKKSARGLVGFRRVTAGGEFHPAPKTLFKLNYIAFCFHCQIQLLRFCRILAFDLYNFGQRRFFY
jgi:hypothetical protein